MNPNYELFKKHYEDMKKGPWNFRDKNQDWILSPPDTPILAFPNPQCMDSVGIKYFPYGLCAAAMCYIGKEPAWLAWCHAPAEPEIPDYHPDFDKWADGKAWPSCVERATAKLGWEAAMNLKS